MEFDDGWTFRAPPQIGSVDGRQQIIVRQPIAKPYYFDDEDTNSTVPSYYFDDNHYDDFEEPLGDVGDPFTANHSHFSVGEILAQPNQQATGAFDFSGNTGYSAPSVRPSARPLKVPPSSGRTAERFLVTSSRSRL